MIKNINFSLSTFHFSVKSITFASGVVEEARLESV